LVARGDNGESEREEQAKELERVNALRVNQERAEAQRVAAILASLSDKDRLHFEIQLAILDELKTLNSATKSGSSSSANVARGFLGLAALMALDE
jgi:hypothetical protein